MAREQPYTKCIRQMVYSIYALNKNALSEVFLFSCGQFSNIAK